MPETQSPCHRPESRLPDGPLAETANAQLLVDLVEALLDEVLGWVAGVDTLLPTMPYSVFNTNDNEKVIKVTPKTPGRRRRWSVDA
jgi:hypothetical protein